jgi:RNase H-fold protein (predicted Holliday junction resolvase)
LNFDSEFLQLVRQQAVVTFKKLFKGEEEDLNALTIQYKELLKKIDRLEERYIEEEINSDLYKKYSSKYLLKKHEFERKL